MAESFSGPAVVEIMGRVRVAGIVSEGTVFGAAMVRVDVPAVDGHPAFTRYYHPQALYSLCPCDEGTMFAVAKHERHPPIERWQMPILAQAATRPIGEHREYVEDRGDEEFEP